LFAVFLFFLLFALYMPGKKPYNDRMETIFGPVPSRRLGRSIGVNNVPPKHCTYACVYCQLGKALSMQTRRSIFYPPADLASAAQQRINEIRKKGETIDYVTIVPDGEPTLDAQLGILISLLQESGIPVAVISNGSLLGSPDVRKDLLKADWVSVKVDAVSDAVWHKIDRPRRDIDHRKMLDGISQFAGDFRRKGDSILTTETMLVEGLNTADVELEAIGRFVGTLAPRTAYLAVPTRPPAEAWVEPASEESLARGYSIFSQYLTSVEHLTGYEGNQFSASGDARQDILSITAVHPMRSDAVEELLKKDDSTFTAVEELLENDLLTKSTYGGHTYYVRRFRKNT
jgi:wyosine [tRNA(Phe)-imidazoG37] synthetase (radical SAM superfamily)